ncbi:hypothetical protein BH11PLA2_BH11PLA2_32510 [soil metagenome]
MRSLILLLLLTAPAFGQLTAKTTGPATILSVTGDAPDKPLAVDAMRAMKLSVPDAKFVSWEVDPVYDLVIVDGKPTLVSGNLGLKIVTKASEIGLKEPGQDPVFKEIGPGEVIVWGKTPGKVRLVARGVVGEVNQRIATLVIEVTGPRPPPLKPMDPGLPVEPITDRDYYLFVGADGPTPPAVLESLKLTAWDEVKKKDGVKYLPLSEVPSKDGKSPLPAGTALPCLLKLVEGPATSKIVPPPHAIPLTNEAVEKVKAAK